MKTNIKMLEGIQTRNENFHGTDIVEYITTNSEIMNNYIKERIYFEQAVNFNDSFGSISFAILSDHLLINQKD